MRTFGAMILGEAHNGNKPEDPEDVVLRRLETGDRLKQRLGLTPAGGVAQAALSGNGMRADLVKLFLENDRETLRIQNEDARENRKLRVLEETKDIIKDNIPDAIGAVKDFAQRHNQEAGGEKGEKKDTAGAPMSRVIALACATCKKEFGLPQRPEPGQHLTCPYCKADLEVQV